MYKTHCHLDVGQQFISSSNILVYLEYKSYTPLYISFIFIDYRPQRSFIERAEHSLHSLMYNSNSSGVDIQRSNHATEFGSPSAAVSQSAGSSSRQSGYIPAAANNHNSSTRTGHDSNSSSIGSNTTTGLSHFLSNFNLWRASAGQPSGTTAERQRSTSLSHVSADQSRNYASVEGATADESSAMSSPRAALTRLLSSRDGRNSCAHPGGESSGSSSSSSGSSNSNHQHQHHHHIQNPRPRRDSSTTNSATTTAFSMRDLTFATAQEFLAEATMNGMGLGRVYVTHSLPSHMWTVNGNISPPSPSICSFSPFPDASMNL